MVVAIAAGKVLALTGVPLLEVLPFCVAAIVLLVVERRRWAEVPLVFGFVLLLVARSALAPPTLAALAPALIAGHGLAALAVRRRSVRAVRGMWVLAALGVVLSASSAVSSDAMSTLKALGVAVFWPVVLLLAGNVSTRSRLLLLRGLIAACVLEVGLVVLEAFVDVQVVRDGVAATSGQGAYVVRPNLILGAWTNRAQGTTGYPIPLAMLLVVGIAAALFGRVVQRRWVTVTLVIVLLAGVLATGTRSALLSLACVLLAGLVGEAAAGARLRGRYLVVVLGVVLASLVGVALFLWRSISSSDFSLTHRGNQIQSAFELLRLPAEQLWLGSGYNSAGRLNAAGYLTADNMSTVDNAFVSQLAMTGLVGLLLFAAVLVRALLRSAPFEKAAIAGLGAGMFFLDMESWHLLMMLLWFAVGVSEVSARDACGAGLSGFWRASLRLRKL